MSAALSRIAGIAIKEWQQLLRDKFTAALVFGVPLVQLLLFGFAIDLNVRHWPAAWVPGDGSFIEQSAKARIQQMGWFDFVADTKREVAETMLTSGAVRFVLVWPANAEQTLVNGGAPKVTALFDASDPWVAQAVNSATQRLLAAAPSASSPSAEFGHYSVSVEPRFATSAAIAHYSARWVLPGLIGVVLTLSLTLLSALCVVREVERGTWDGLRMSAASASEIMVGKLSPYLAIGAIMLAALLLLCRGLFALSAADLTLFLTAGVFMAANLALGLALSLIAKSQMQAMQLGVFFYLPSILLSGFLFPFHVMPQWARIIGAALPLTHFLPIARAAMVRDAPAEVMHALMYQHVPAIVLFAFAASAVALFLLRRR